MKRHSVKRQLLSLTALWCAVLAACTGSPRSSGPEVSPVYNAETGKLEKLVSDKNGDGKVDTWAFMDGAVLKHIEQDRNGDGQPDRWEYYEDGTMAKPGRIIRAEEANGPSNVVTRREHFEDGLIRRVIDDTDADTRPDKWESYESGRLVRVDLDLVGKGYPSQRLTYGAEGSVLRVETDPDGDGVFTQVPGTAGSEK